MAPPKGFVPWNKGLTKETSETLQVVSDKNRKSVKETHVSKINPERWKEQCRKHSEYMLGENNGMYGKTHSKEARKKISEMKSGVKRAPFSNEYRRNISRAKKGKKRKPFSEEWKRKIGESIKGEKNGMYGLKGPNNPNWKGGTLKEPYCQEWTKDLKEFIKQRDGHKCMNPDCWKNDNVLSIHHIDYNKKNCDPSNLITVCRSCNSRANTDRVWYTNWYQAILSKRYKI